MKRGTKMRYTSQYDALVETIHSSDSYKDSTAEEKKQVDDWLVSENVKKYFSARIVPELSLHESLILGIMNSDSLQQRLLVEQQKVAGYLNSERFRNVVDALEERMALSIANTSL